MGDNDGWFMVRQLLDSTGWTGWTYKIYSKKVGDWPVDRWHPCWGGAGCTMRIERSGSQRPAPGLNCHSSYEFLRPWGPSAGCRAWYNGDSSPNHLLVLRKDQLGWPSIGGLATCSLLTRNHDTSITINNYGYLVTTMEFLISCLTHWPQRRCSTRRCNNHGSQRGIT